MTPLYEVPGGVRPARTEGRVLAPRGKGRERGVRVQGRQSFCLGRRRSSADDTMMLHDNMDVLKATELGG